MIKIPLDIPSFDQKNIKDFRWPVSYDEYDYLSYGFVDNALKILENQNGDIKIALTCKLSDILIDICHVARQAIEIQSIKNAGFDIIYCEKSSTRVNYLLGKNSIVLRNTRKNLFKKNLLIYLQYLKRVLSNTTSPTAHGYHAMGFNYLMKEWIEAENIDTANILVDFYINGAPVKNEKLCNDISHMFNNALRNRYDFKYPVDSAIKEIISHHLEQALGDIDFIKRSKLNRSLRKGLVSGTPKYKGRLLSWYVQDQGKKVIRYAHGGERVFYKDYVWPIAELPYCSEYFLHSQTEANKVAERIGNGAYATTPEMKNIQFNSRGSDKHQRICKNSVEPEKNKTLVYVSGVYLGDIAPNFPAFKVPDSPYFDFQIRLLKFLRNEGWHIIIKPHPKGVYNPTELLQPYADEVIIAPFNPNMFKAEIFLFDFAGTAFFDTLASKQRTTLLNLGNRPFDKSEYTNLEKRCSIYNCGFDEYGRIDLNKDAILQAIKSAPKGKSIDFIERYAK